MNVKYEFLNEDLKEQIYMEQCCGYAQNDSNLVFRFKKSIYGLKQYPRAWYLKMDLFIFDTSFMYFIITPFPIPREKITIS